MRYTRKPYDINIRSYVARVREINATLINFPPFDVNQGFEEEELLDILESGIPAS